LSYTSGVQRFERNYLIAEIGINHNGDSEIAKSLIVEAQLSGCQAVKFQYRNLSRTYSGLTREIGDEILSTEIERNFINVSEIIYLVKFAKSLGLEVGISFFDELDVTDFEASIDLFDFFKIPSVEITNLSLINKLLSFEKFVYISTGASTELEVEEIFELLPKDGWMPLHCVSNYPTQILNSKIGYLNFLAERWGRPVGYSSHDEFWEICLIAITQGATVIERHITLDKSQVGLDHTTSSTPDEFLRLSSILSNYPQIMSGFGPRYPNQGELINRQNLGKSYFAKHNVAEGEKFRLENFEYRHPRIGLSLNEVDRYLNGEIKVGLRKADALTKAHFSKVVSISERVVDICNSHDVSLPVRIHDYFEISNRFPLNHFELHLSFGEIDRLDDFIPLSKKHKITIHFPDYISPTALFDPFSEDKAIEKGSRDVIQKLSNFVNRLSDLTSTRITTVTSLSQFDGDKESFYTRCAELQSDLNSSSSQFTYQWLPPFAWYFGGTEKLHVFNSLEDVDFILRHRLGITLDTSHFLMSSNFFEFDALNTFLRLKSQIQHLHLADAKSFDGEGFQVGMGDPSNLPLLLAAMRLPLPKVIEVWQGHLNLYQGFQEALVTLAGYWDE
jgi:sialic acid synthase SpsE/sugar phosphate isomerase/epimerase